MKPTLYMAKIGGWNPVVAFATDEETARRLAVKEKKKWFRDDLERWSWKTVSEYYGASVHIITDGTVLVE